MMYISLYSEFIVAAIIKAMMASTATIPSTSGAMVTLFQSCCGRLKSEIDLEISEEEEIPKGNGYILRGV